MYRRKFPTSAFEKLKHTQKVGFHFIRLENELVLLYAYEEFATEHTYKLMRSLNSKQLVTALPEVYKLGLLCQSQLHHQ